MTRDNLKYWNITIKSAEIGKKGSMIKTIAKSCSEKTGLAVHPLKNLYYKASVSAFG